MSEMAGLRNNNFSASCFACSRQDQLFGGGKLCRSVHRTREVQRDADRDRHASCPLRAHAFIIHLDSAAGRGGKSLKALALHSE